ncbi:MAG: excinuclease ABC subunit UvrA [Patescibacteria group bacterium]|nr:excinuclease ABC subunit UvrA [Patescibacteria group bacterium]
MPKKTTKSSKKSKTNGVDKIKIVGARVNNLKNISLQIPKNKLVVVTGISGSGKSSLAFDTLYAEGQRRYVESLSSYARQFIGTMDKPDVDEISGLSPAIAIDQRTVSHNPRSTVGTITEIYDYLRLLFARAGTPHCPNCGKIIIKQTKEQILERLEKLGEGKEIIFLAPVIKEKKGDHRKILEEILEAGFARVRLDGKLHFTKDAVEFYLEPTQKHTVEIVVGQTKILNYKKAGAEELKKVRELLDTALDLGDGFLSVKELVGNKEQEFSEHFSCPICNINLPEIEPRLFSFNSPYGACANCAGLGTVAEVDPELVIPNKKLTIAEGAIRPWVKLMPGGGQNALSKLNAAANRHGFSINTPASNLTKDQLKIVFYGDGDFEGVVNDLMRRYRETESGYIKSEVEKYMRTFKCSECGGARLKKEALAVSLAGVNIASVVNLNLAAAEKFFQTLDKKLSAREKEIARQILKEINRRLGFLTNVGLDYLSLDRPASTLSGGELQRIRLATQMGSSLSGVLFVLDEPSIGLHQRDNQKLILALQELKKLGNSIVVVEHDEETMRAADFLVDVGPGAGKHGGEIVALGTPAEVAKNKKSLTGQYLSHKLHIPLPAKYRRGSGKFLEIKSAAEFNLKNINVKFPLSKFISITGVSGSGKSTLITEILSKALSQHFYGSKENPGQHKEIKGMDLIDKVITIDQSPIGRTPRSNPATYTGVFTGIRDLFVELPEAKMRNFTAGHFSFNVIEGRCPVCEGDGYLKIEMNFLPDVYVLCEECLGARYNKKILEVHYRGKNIADVLNMTIEEALQFFGDISAIKGKLQILSDVGLGYMHLGQSATTLSGGEAQRIKLATELARRDTGQTLYILDEPTTGLHFADIARLLDVLNRLVDKGNTVLVIEHNLDVIKSSDWVIDLGPEGGDKGGYIVAQGTPKDVVKIKKSYTGQYLKKVIK